MRVSDAISNSILVIDQKCEFRNIISVTERRTMAERARLIHLLPNCMKMLLIFQNFFSSKKQKPFHSFPSKKAKNRIFLNVYRKGVQIFESEWKQLTLKHSQKTASDDARLAKFALKKVFEKFDRTQIKFLFIFCQSERDNSGARLTVCASSVTAIDDGRLLTLAELLSRLYLLVNSFYEKYITLQTTNTYIDLFADYTI